jgi:hypothetical protein
MCFKELPDALYSSIPRNSLTISMIITAKANHKTGGYQGNIDLPERETPSQEVKEGAIRKVGLEQEYNEFRERELTQIIRNSHREGIPLKDIAEAI